MKRLFLTLSLIFTISAFCRDQTLVSALEEGEEPGLRHYYFFYAEKGPIKDIVRVRWVIDSDSRNNAKVTDYCFASEGLRVQKMLGTGEARKILVQGGDAELEKISDYLLTTKDSAHMLLPEKEDKVLPRAQRCDLYTLITLLARDRRAQNTTRHRYLEISISETGGLSLGSETISTDLLMQKLREARTKKDGIGTRITLRAGPKTEYQDVLKVITMCRSFGISDIEFSCERNPKRTP